MDLNRATFGPNNQNNTSLFSNHHANIVAEIRTAIDLCLITERITHLHHASQALSAPTP
jgi:hypothetical protein